MDKYALMTTGQLLGLRGHKCVTNGTLRNRTKDELIEYIRCLEHNWATEVECVERQYKILQRYDKCFDLLNVYTNPAAEELLNIWTGEDDE